MGHEHVPQAELERIFRSADRDGSGVVGHDEVSMHYTLPPLTLHVHEHVHVPDADPTRP